MTATEKLYRNLEAERTRKGWTISEAAEKLGITEATYVNRKKKLSRMSGDELVKISTVFGVSVDYLLGLTDKINIA